MKKIFFYIILLIFIISNSNSITNAEKNTSSFSFESKYELYQERVANICNQYLYVNKNIKGKKIRQVLKITDKNKEITKGYSITGIKKTHRKNMNDIYKCGLLNVQKKSLLLIKKDLIKQNASISKKIAGKIDNKLSKLKYSLKALKCNDSKEKSSIIKLNILSQTTYETCKYVSYLEYLKEYNLEFNNVLPKGKNKFTTLEIPNIQKEKINALNKEIEHTYKVFPLAFNAYSEYENNITIHLLLQLIRDDYIVLREKLHKALNPINQVVYKIANVMTK